MQRHASNPNLHLYHQGTYEGLSIQVAKGPCVEEYLRRLRATIDYAQSEYSRVFAFRVDLRFPDSWGDLGYVSTNEILDRFFESFKAKIAHNRKMARQKNKYAPDSRVRYAWAREFGRNGRPHYHLLILLNREAFNTLGKMQSENENMRRRLEEAWASALGVRAEEIVGLVEVPENPIYRLHHNDPESLEALFYRASYLCKADTKRFGDGSHSFGASRG